MKRLQLVKTIKNLFKKGGPDPRQTGFKGKDLIYFTDYFMDTFPTKEV